MNLLVKQCAEEAYKIGYEYFGVQDHKECHGNGTNYDKHGESDKCFIHDNRTGYGMGEGSANFVYRIDSRVKK